VGATLWLRTAMEERAATAAGLDNGEAATASVPSTGHRHGRRERQMLGSLPSMIPRDHGRRGTAALCQDQTKGADVFWVAHTRIGTEFGAFIWEVQICADRQ
jgi:hypothetical protein